MCSRHASGVRVCPQRQGHFQRPAELLKGGGPVARSIVIIGAGMGGLAAGIYGRMNGYETRIFEMHTGPGGQCASWKRKGYTFDACIHHFFGCKPGSAVYRLRRLTAPFAYGIAA